MTYHCIGHKVVVVYDSPAEIKEAGLSEITLEVSAVDSADMMSRLVVIIHCLLCHVSLMVQFTTIL